VGCEQRDKKTSLKTIVVKLYTILSIMMNEYMVLFYDMNFALLNGIRNSLFEAK